MRTVTPISVIFLALILNFTAKPVELFTGSGNTPFAPLTIPVIGISPDTVKVYFSYCNGVGTTPIKIYNSGGASLNFALSQVSNFFEDFENGLDKWQYTGSWGISTLAYAGSGSLDDSPGSYYNNYANQTITLKDSLIIQNPDSCMLKFWLIRNMECCCDYLRPQISVNNGEWVSLGSYNCTTNNWEQIQLSLSSYVNMGDYIKFRFLFTADYSATGAGVNIDKLSISGIGASTNVLTFLPDAGNILAGDSATVNLTVNAQGMESGIYYVYVVINSNDPVNPSFLLPVEITILGTPDIQIDSTIINMPDVIAYNSVTESFWVRNTGCDTLFVDTVMSSLAVFIPQTTNFLVLPKDSVNFELMFYPLVAGSYTANLVFFNNDADDTIQINGMALPPPLIALSPSSINIVLSDCSDTVISTLYVHNNGLTTLQGSLSSTYSAANIPPPLCQPDNTSNCYSRGIIRVKLNTIDNSSANACAGFENFDTISTTLTEGQQYTLEVFTGTGSENCRVWIDYNADQYFDPDNELILYNTYSSYFSAYFVVPTGLPYGLPLRMRVMSDDYYNPPFEACTNPVYGQAEDYTIFIGQVPEIIPDIFSIPAGDSTAISLLFDAHNFWAGQYQGNIYAASNDPLNPLVSIPYQITHNGLAQIELSTHEIFFPDIMQFTCHADSFLVANTGCDSLLITGINITIPEFTVNADTFLLMPGSSKYVVLTFCSDITGYYETEVEIVNSDSTHIVFASCNVLGAPMVQVNPDSLSAVINGCNDSLTIQVNVSNPGSDTLNYQFLQISDWEEDFEDGLSGWYTINYTPYDLWHVSQLDAHSPTHALWCGFESSGNYANGAVINTAIVSPPIDLTYSSGEVLLSFWETYNTEGGSYDKCMVDLSLNNGASWIQLRGGGLNGYSGGWVNNSYNISSYVGQEILIRFYFNTLDGVANSYSGWFVDDIKITNAGTGNSWLSISPDSANVLPGGSTTVDFTFSSQGIPGGQQFQVVNLISNSPLTPNITIPVSLDVNGQANAALSQDSLFFAPTMVNTSAIDSIHIYNTGCDTLFVDTIQLPSVHYGVQSATFFVLPYDTALVNILFTPQDTGVFQQQITLLTNTGNLYVYVSGTGTGAPLAGIDPDTLVVTLNSCHDSIIVPITLSNNGLADLAWTAVSDFNLIDNKALLYDSPDDYTYLGYWTAGSQWTLEAWVKPISLPSGRKTIIGGVANCLDYAIVMENGEFGVAIRPPGGCSQIMLSGVDAVVGAWYHISATNDGNTAKIYVNGILRNEGLVDPNYSGFPYMYMGYEYCCYNQGFPGTIDEVRVWNYPRTSYDINNWMHRLLQGNETGLYAYYKLDEGSGSTIYDQSTHGFNGNTYYTTWVDSDAPINDFLNLDPLGGIVLPGSSTLINLAISAEHLLSGTFQGNIIISSNDPLHDTLVIPITIQVNGEPEIAVSDSCLSFGPILQYASKTDTLYIVNSGCDTLLISGLSPSATAFTANLSTVTLAPGMQQMVEVTFNPAAIGSYTDTLWIFNNDELSWICLKGEATPRPNLVLNASIFQDTMICEVNGTQNLLIKNTGMIPLEYTIPIIAQSWLTITPHTGLLLSGDSAIHQINYSKSGLSAGNYEGQIIINSNDPLNSPKNISVQLNVLNAYHPLDLGPDVNVCIGEAVTLDAGPDYESYLWHNGLTTSNIVVSVPGTYSVAVKDFTYDCYFYDTLEVNWYEYPIVFAGNDTTICQGSEYTFSPQFQNLLPISPSVCQVGTGSTVTSNVGPSPFGTYYMDDRTQMLYKVSELVAAGLSTGGITAVAFNVVGIGSPAMQGFTIRMGHTALNAMNGFLTGNEVVYSHSSYSPVSGWNVFTFQTPFYWNGTQNIVVEICYNNNSYISSSGVQYTSIANSVWSAWCDNCSPGCSLSGGSGFSERANIQFYGSGDPTYYTWNGPNGYISHSRNAVLNNVGFQNAGFYYLSTDNSYGCTDKDTVIVAVNPSPVVTASNDVSIVYGTNTQLNVSITGGIPPFSYQWTPAIGLTNTTIANPFASPTSTTTYAIKVISQNQCSDADNVTVTVLPIYQINGTISYKNASGTPLNGMTVYLKGPGGLNLDTAVTDQGGSYFFDELINNTYTYSIVSTKAWGGGNATDALLVAKHIVFLYSLSGLNLTAADVNNSGTLSSADPLLILRRSVGSLSSFPAGDWLFSTSPVVITNANVTHNIQGLCYGDVNGTNVPGNKAPPLVILSESGTIAVPESRIIEVPIRCSESIHAGAVTLGLRLSPDIEEILDVEVVSAGLEWNVTEGDILRIAWENMEGISLEPGDMLLKIKLRLNENADSQTPLFTLDGDCEIADPEGRVLTGTFLTIPHMVKVAAYAVFNAEAVPNPFVDDVSLVYDIPEDGRTTIRLYDVYGRLLKEILDATHDSGHYKMLMRGENLPAGLYQLEFRHLSSGNLRQKTVSIVKTH